MCLKIYENIIFPGYYVRPAPTNPRRLGILRLLLQGGADVRMTHTFDSEEGWEESVFEPPLTYLYRQKQPVDVEESESNLAMLKLLLAFGMSYFFVFCFFVN